MKIFKFAILAIISSVIVSCSPQKRIVYLQDIQGDQAIKAAEQCQIRIKPFDRITIVVSSKDAELAAPFNAYSSYNSLSSNAMTSSVNGVNSLQIRTVDADGYVEMPIIGKVICAGKTRTELAESIANQIIKEGYINDAQVNVQFPEMRLFVIGEVTRPGSFEITKDKITILQALAMAGDLTIYGNRQNVQVVRQIGDKNHVFELNLLTSDFMSSPAFYLQQDDVVYVQPNRYKAATSEINANRTFWISIVSTLISVATLVTTISLRK